MIAVRGLTKRYRETEAVRDLTFDVEPGLVTGFLGPNGAGKSTTMRMVLGLDRPTAGQALVRGRAYAAHPAPLHEVGALLDAGALHPGRTARDHLRVAARTHGIPDHRVEEVLAQVGLADAAHRRVKGFSLGMRQRLGIAAALLGDPAVVLFDEPVNGLDLDGVRWFRGLLRGLADEGRTVLVSSHLMSEVEQTADRLLVVGRGRLLADTTVEELLARAGRSSVRVRTPDPAPLAQALARQGLEVATTGDELVVAHATAAEVGDAAHAAGVPVHLLTEVRHTLEDAYLRLTEQHVEHQGTIGAAA